MDENKETQIVEEAEAVNEVSEEVIDEEYEGNEESFEYEDDEEYYEESKIKVALRKVFSVVFNKKTIATVLAVIILVQVVAGVVLGNAVLKPDGFIASSKAEDVIRFPLSEKVYIDWLESKAEKVTMKNSDGKNLSGLLLKNNDTSHSYIIICHSMTSNSRDMALYAHHFYDLGFNVLLPDSRGYGDDEYNKISMGYFEKNDVLDWVNDLVKKDDNAKVFLFGVGMGGSTVLMASELELPENVKGIISDSAYSDVKALFKENIKDFYGFSSFPIVNIASLFVKATAGWDFSDVNVVDCVKNAQVPILIIHGGEDGIVPVDQSNDLYEACPVKGSDHILIRGAMHCQAQNFKSEKYWQGVDEFILVNLG